MTHKHDKKSYFTIQDLLCKTVKTQCKQTHRFIFPNRKHLSIFLLLPLYSLFYRQKTDKESVNIFSKVIY